MGLFFPSIPGLWGLGKATVHHHESAPTLVSESDNSEPTEVARTGRWQPVGLRNSSLLKLLTEWSAGTGQD